MREGEREKEVIYPKKKSSCSGNLGSLAHFDFELNVMINVADSSILSKVLKGSVARMI